MSKTPFVALYPTDFLAGVGHLGNSELGIYTRLLLVYYRDARPLPFDVDRLRRLALVFSPEEFRALDAVVSEFFQLSTEPDGTRVWRHKRADRELAEANARHTKAVDRAKTAAEARWGKRNAPSNAPSMLQALPEQCQPEPEPEPDKKNTNTRTSADAECWPDVEASVFRDWLGIRAEQGLKNDRIALQAARKTIEASGRPPNEVIKDLCLFGKGWA